MFTLISFSSLIFQFASKEEILQFLIICVSVIGNGGKREAFIVSKHCVGKLVE